MSSGPLESFCGRVFAGRYLVERLIGKGGMGAVYEAVRVDIGRRVAVKVLLDVDVEGLARFRQEALASAALNHPHVVQVIELVESRDAPPFIVMELLEGEPLSAVLERERALTPDRAVRIAAQMLSALGAAHDAGIIHRDIKPSNVILVRTAHGAELVKLVDFGIAKLLDAGGYKTRTGMMLGTPVYMAPEQVRAEPADARTDVHAVGLCLYEMLTGVRAYARPNMLEILEAVRGEVPPRVDSVVRDLPRGLADVVAKALEKDALARYSATGMLAALEPWVRTYGDVAITMAHHSGSVPPNPLAAPLTNASAPPPMSYGQAHAHAPTALPTPYAAIPAQVATAPLRGAHAFAPAPPAARSSMVPMLAVAGGVVLLVAVLGIVAAVLVVGGRFSLPGAAPTTSALPTTATTVPFEQGAPPRASASTAPNGTGTKAGTRPTSPGQPPSTASAAPSTGNCQCISDAVPFGLCPVLPKEVSCDCAAQDPGVSGLQLCATTRDKNKNCPNLFSYRGVNRGSCSGVDNFGTTRTGLLRCNMCRNPPKVSGTQGAKCEGFSTSGEKETGTLRCD